MQTLKIKYHTQTQGEQQTIKQFQKEYSNALRWMYNRVREGVKEKQREQQARQLNNINNLDSWFIRSAAKQAQWMNDTNKGQTIVFGGRKNFVRRCKGLITREEYLEKRLLPICSIGEAPQKANRKFKLSQDLDKVTFKPNKGARIELLFDGLGKNYKRTLERLYILQEAKSLPITYELSQEYVYVIFDEKQAYDPPKREVVRNRVMALDLNPDYVGWTIVDWKGSSEFSLVKRGVYSFKPLNDKENRIISLGIPSDDKRVVHMRNKRRHEVFEVCKNLVSKAVYYGCEMFALEDLDVLSCDKERGRKYNRLVNNMWCREKMVQNIEKKCNIFGVKLLRVKPNYSSFVGNVVFRQLRLSDMELSSVEVGRRAYEFKKQYIDKTEIQRKNIVFPNDEDFKVMIAQSLEELGLNHVLGGLKDVYDSLKKTKFRYRLSLDDVEHPMFSRFFSQRSLILKYNN